MTAIAAGVFKKVTVKRQASLNTVATGGAATGQDLRRVTSTLDLKKATYQSNEIRSSQQVADMRHGLRSVEGSVSGELSPGTYQMFAESVLRQVAQAAITTGAIITVASAVTAGAAGTYTRSAGSFITDGFKLFMIVRASGFATTGVPNNAHNCIITALTATVMTVLFLDGVAMGAKVAGDSVTIATVGKHSYVPLTGHVKHYYTFEHWFGDIAQSEVFQDCVISAMNYKLPPTGMITAEFPVMGLDMPASLADGTQYFTSPTAATTTGVTAAVNGVLLVNGVAVGLVTNMDININGNYTRIGGVVGANVDPDIIPGTLTASGTVSILFADATYRDAFLNETIASIVGVFTTDNTAAADFVAFAMTRCKFGGADKDDGVKALTLTLPFTALEDTAAGTTKFQTTVFMQDSQWT